MQVARARRPESRSMMPSALTARSPIAPVPALWRPGTVAAPREPASCTVQLVKRRPNSAPVPHVGATRATAPRAADAASRIHAIVRTIPRGRVVTYGELAGLAGISAGHRVAARAMRSCPETLPWHRVLGKKDARRGRVAIDDPFHAELQRGLLEREGVVFDENGFVPLARHGWLMTRVGPARRERGGQKVTKASMDRARASTERPRRTPRPLGGCRC